MRSSAARETASSTYDGPGPDRRQPGLVRAGVTTGLLVGHRPHRLVAPVRAVLVAPPAGHIEKRGRPTQEGGAAPDVSGSAIRPLTPRTHETGPRPPKRTGAGFA